MRERVTINKIVSSIKNKTIVEKTKAVDYQQMSADELEELRLDYQNEKTRLEERVEWLTNECEELQAIIDERASDDANED